MILGRIRNAVKVSPLLVHLKQYVLGDVRQWSLSGDESSRLKKKTKNKKKTTSRNKKFNGLKNRCEDKA